jgi:translocation and assembly module TamA
VCVPLAAQPRFGIEVVAPEPLQAFVLRHLELQRYREIEDLDAQELARLRNQAAANARNLLATQGYFSPRITVEHLPPTAVGAEPLGLVRLRVEPGPPTRVRAVALDVLEAQDNTDGQAAALQTRLRESWSLREGEPFTQSAWDAAKSQALRQLTERRHPNARLQASQADIDPDAQSADLSLRYALGPVVTIGEIEVSGHERYSPEIARRLVRLGGLTPGSEYSLAALQAAQRRLAESGYYDSAFVFVDSGTRSEGAPVQVQLREARRQRLELGVGISTDSGPRLSAKHTHHHALGTTWRATSQLLLDRNTPQVETEWTSPVDEQGWRWVASGLAQRQNDANLSTTSQRLRAGQTQDGETLDRSYYLQLDRARIGNGAIESALSVNYAWTRRRFDDLVLPRSGYGLGVELGAGTTLSAGQRSPYLRTRVRWQGIHPAPGQDNGRLVLRLEAGAVLARDGAPVPATQQFLTGGDTTVRGYGLREIGVPQPGGGVVPGRYLGVASLEWQRPLGWGSPGEWEHTLFIDTGGVADQPRQLKARTGIGTGVRYNSPVGPLQLDVAYGLEPRRLRLHLSVGITF